MLISGSRLAIFGAKRSRAAEPDLWTVVWGSCGLILEGVSPGLPIPKPSSNSGDAHAAVAPLPGRCRGASSKFSPGPRSFLLPLLRSDCASSKSAAASSSKSADDDVSRLLPPTATVLQEVLVLILLGPAVGGASREVDGEAARSGRRRAGEIAALCPRRPSVVDQAQYCGLDNKIQILKPFG
ncbi:hypothetical protein ABZP36_012712 [Zizania latifolia]